MATVQEGEQIWSSHERKNSLSRTPHPVKPWAHKPEFGGGGVTRWRQKDTGSRGQSVTAAGCAYLEGGVAGSHPNSLD